MTMNISPLTEEEISEFNDIVTNTERSDKDIIVMNIRSKFGDTQVEYIRSLINPN